MGRIGELYNYIFKQRGICCICGTPMSNASRCNIDHLVPRSRGGKDYSSNKGAAHVVCNEVKGDMTFEECFEDLDFLIHYKRMLSNWGGEGYPYNEHYHELSKIPRKVVREASKKHLFKFWKKLNKDDIHESRRIRKVEKARKRKQKAKASSEKLRTRRRSPLD